MAVHARLSASAAHRWMNCPASLRLSDGVPHTESPYASLGTMAHSIASYCLDKGLDAHAILDEHADSVQFYLDFCRQFPGGRAEVDLSPYLTQIDPDTGGTADYVALAGDRLVVTDFKFGTGVPVSAAGNKQLKTYALGALLACSRAPKEVEVCVVQPRLENPDDWVQRDTFQAIELIDFAADIQEAAAATRDPESKPVPGEDQCRWCPAAKANRCDVAVKTRYKKHAGPRISIEDFPMIGGTGEAK